MTLNDCFPLLQVQDFEVVAGAGDGFGFAMRRARRGVVRTSPISRDAVAALGTCAGDDEILQNIMPGTLDEKLAAFGTRSVRCVAENISFVDVMQSRVESNFPRAMQCFGRRARFVSQFEIGMKRGE